MFCISIETSTYIWSSAVRIPTSRITNWGALVRDHIIFGITLKATADIGGSAVAIQTAACTNWNTNI
jgi:hypothetical protein